MALSIEASGAEVVSDMEEAFKTGKMVPSTKVTGAMIWLMAKEG